MSKFNYRAIQVIMDDSGKWIITDKAIKEEYEIEAETSKLTIDIGNEKLSIVHPEVPVSWFLTGATSV